MSSLKFGTSGLRGLVSELIGAPAYAYARAFCEMIREDKAAGPKDEVLIGYDLRASSPEIARQCMLAVAAAGLVPVDAGAVPTPALALAGSKLGAPAIMVTGSHIPEDRNGLKFYSKQGEIDKTDEARILAWHAKLAIASVPATSIAPSQHDVITPYCARYTDFFGTDALKDLTIGVYEHSSVGRDIISAVLSALGAKSVRLGRSERFIPVDTEALRPEDEVLALGWARDFKLDAIVSTDGDADRPLIADETGHYLRGDLVGALAAVALGADAIVTPVTSNSALESSGLFQKILRTRVGSPYVIAGIAEAAALGARVVVGFEANGGVLLGSPARQDGRVLSALPTRDALLPIVAVLSQMTGTHKKLSELAGTMHFFQALSNRLPNVPQDRTADLIARLDMDNSVLHHPMFTARGGVTARDRQDGLRMTLGNGETLHLRASGNAPELRVYVEAPTRAAVEALLAEGLGFAKQETA